MTASEQPSRKRSAESAPKKNKKWPEKDANGPRPATGAGAGRANVCRIYSGPDEEIGEHFLVEGMMKKIRNVLQRAPPDSRPIPFRRGYRSLLIELRFDSPYIA